MSYKAAVRLKLGKDDYIERGDSVTESDVNNWDGLIASESIVTDARFDQLFPQVQQGSNQAPGTPSNLEKVEGTDLQVNLPAPGEDVPVTRVPEGNPADPPKVEGAQDPGTPSDEDDDPADADE